jgi:hypothetical protein
MCLVTVCLFRYLGAVYFEAALTRIIRRYYCYTMHCDLVDRRASNWQGCRDVLEHLAAGIWLNERLLSDTEDYGPGDYKYIELAMNVSKYPEQNDRCLSYDESHVEVHVSKEIKVV